MDMARIQGDAGTIVDCDLASFVFSENSHAQVEVLPGSDHFFAGALDKIETRVAEFANGV